MSVLRFLKLGFLGAGAIGVAGPPYVVPTVTVKQRDGTLVTQRDAQQVYLRGYVPTIVTVKQRDATLVTQRDTQQIYLRIL